MREQYLRMFENMVRIEDNIRFRYASGFYDDFDYNGLRMIQFAMCGAFRELCDLGYESAARDIMKLRAELYGKYLRSESDMS